MTMTEPGPTFAVAPMMDWTDRHCRFFHRRLTREALLYTEMVTANAVLHGDRDRLLGFDAAEQPVALQLGGSEPAALAAAARTGEGFGYREINLNVGCPSDRVQGGRFGACLMAEPALVGDLVSAMRAAVAVPVTVKCRIGIDEQDPEAALDALADAVFAAGADALIVHARKAWLCGLSPKENRQVPPLDHGRVHRLKARLPSRRILVNGGIGSIDAALPHLDLLDGVMVGRAAYQTPEMLLAVDPRLFGGQPAGNAMHAAETMIPYVERHVRSGGRVHDVTRHMLGLFAGRPGARAYRRHLATAAAGRPADAAVLREALAMIGQGATVGERTAA